MRSCLTIFRGGFMRKKNIKKHFFEFLKANSVFSYNHIMKYVYINVPATKIFSLSDNPNFVELFQKPNDIMFFPITINKKNNYTTKPHYQWFKQKFFYRNKNLYGFKGLFKITNFNDSESLKKELNKTFDKPLSDAPEHDYNFHVCVPYKSYINNALGVKTKNFNNNMEILSIMLFDNTVVQQHYNYSKKHDDTYNDYVVNLSIKQNVLIPDWIHKQNLFYCYFSYENKPFKNIMSETFYDYKHNKSQIIKNTNVKDSDSALVFDRNTKKLLKFYEDFCTFANNYVHSRNEVNDMKNKDLIINMSKLYNYTVLEKIIITEIRLKILFKNDLELLSNVDNNNMFDFILVSEDFSVLEKFGNDFMSDDFEKELDKKIKTIFEKYF